MKEKEHLKSSFKKEDPAKKRSIAAAFPYKFTIAVALMILLSITAFFLVYNRQVKARQESRNKTSITTQEDAQLTKLKIDGHILFVKNGDLWQISANGENAVKLIDLDNIKQASRSTVNNRIAYTLGRNVTETVTEYDGTMHDIKVDKQQLLLADERGSNSFLVFDNVARWGWIPSTDLLWYETTTLQQTFDWGYIGDGNVWIFDPTTRKAETFVNDDSEYWPLFRAEWSPDGNKLMFVTNDALRVADRKTKDITRIFQLPYVGGDRGGPQPIPYLAWAPDNSAIYTIFSPFLISGEEPNPDVDLKTQHITALRFPLDGSKSTKLIPEVPSTIINEESYPRAHFNDDFSKAFYPRTAQNGTDLILAMYDLTVQKEYVLMKNLGEPKRGLMPYSVPLAWLVGDSVYIFRGDGDPLQGSASVSLIEVNYKTGATKKIASHDGISQWPIGNTLFLSEFKTLFFTMGNKLYFLNQEGITPIADEVSDFSRVEYHLK